MKLRPLIYFLWEMNSSRLLLLHSLATLCRVRAPAERDLTLLSTPLLWLRGGGDAKPVAREMDADVLEMLSQARPNSRWQGLRSSTSEAPLDSVANEDSWLGFDDVNAMWGLLDRLERDEAAAAEAMPARSSGRPRKGAVAAEDDSLEVQLADDLVSDSLALAQDGGRAVAADRSGRVSKEEMQWTGGSAAGGWVVAGGTVGLGRREQRSESSSSDFDRAVRTPDEEVERQRRRLRQRQAARDRLNVGQMAQDRYADPEDPVNEFAQQVAATATLARRRASTRERPERRCLLPRIQEAASRFKKARQRHAELHDMSRSQDASETKDEDMKHHENYEEHQGDHRLDKRRTRDAHKMICKEKQGAAIFQAERRTITQDPNKARDERNMTCALDASGCKYALAQRLEDIGQQRNHPEGAQEHQGSYSRHGEGERSRAQGAGKGSIQAAEIATTARTDGDSRQCRETSHSCVLGRIHENLSARALVKKCQGGTVSGQKKKRGGLQGLRAG